MALLDINNVGVSVAGKELISGIDLALDDGEILAVVGPNGAGKTTLLNTVSGDVDISRGEVRMGGKHLSAWEQREKARSLAVLPQLSLLNFPYTVEEVVSLGRTPHDTGQKQDREIVREAICAMDIEYLSDRLYTQLSGGEKQRTQLARVMAQIWRCEDSKVRLLLLDEPTAALDVGHQQQLMSVIEDFAGTGAGVLMVVHDINIAAKYAHKILALAGGRPIACGPAGDVLSEELLQELFNVEVRIVPNHETHKKCVLM